MKISHLDIYYQCFSALASQGHNVLLNPKNAKKKMHPKMSSLKSSAANNCLTLL